MGTLSFVVTKYGQSRGAPSPAIRDSAVKTSGAHTTSTTASNVEAASADISLSIGDVFIAHADEPMRVRFGGTAATAATGHYIPEGGMLEVEVSEPGFVSAIDVI